MKNRILIIEDDYELREVLAKSFERAGLAVFQAADGREALNLIARDNGGWLAIVTDYSMPHMNGGDLIRALIHRQTPVRSVVLITALTTVIPELKSSLGDPHALPFAFRAVAKPFRVPAFVQQLTEAWRSNDCIFQIA